MDSEGKHDHLIRDAQHTYLAHETEDSARLERAIALADRGEYVSDEEIEALYTEYAGPPEQRAKLRKEMERDTRRAP